MSSFPFNVPGVYPISYFRMLYTPHFTSCLWASHECWIYWSPLNLSQIILILRPARRTFEWCKKKFSSPQQHHFTTREAGAHRIKVVTTLLSWSKALDHDGIPHCWHTVSLRSTNGQGWGVKLSSCLIFTTNMKDDPKHKSSQFILWWQVGSCSFNYSIIENVHDFCETFQPRTSLTFNALPTFIQLCRFDILYFADLFELLKGNILFVFPSLC